VSRLPTRTFPLAVLLLCGACVSTWHTVQASPAAAMATHGEGDARVTRRDGSMVQLRQPAMSGDSIVGYEDPPWDQGGTVKATRQAIPFEDVKSVSVWKRDRTANTVLWVAGATFGALFVLNVIAAPNGGIGGT